MAQYAAAAYCNSADSLTAGTLVSCGNDACPDLETNRVFLEGVLEYVGHAFAYKDVRGPFLTHLTAHMMAQAPLVTWEWTQYRNLSSSPSKGRITGLPSPMSEFSL